MSYPSLQPRLTASRSTQDSSQSAGMKQLKNGGALLAIKPEINGLLNYVTDSTYTEDVRTLALYEPKRGLLVFFYVKVFDVSATRSSVSVAFVDIGGGGRRLWRFVGETLGRRMVRLVCRVEVVCLRMG